MTPFTDDDIEILNTHLKVEMKDKELESRSNQWSCMALNHIQIKALIARLEAAEAWALSSLRPHDETCAIFDAGNYCDCSIKRLETAWRKAAGKS